MLFGLNGLRAVWRRRGGGDGGEKRKMKMEDSGDEVEVVLMNLDLITCWKLEVGSGNYS